MAYFAQINNDNVVVNVVYVDNADCLDENGLESEQVGAAFCNSIIEGRWIQTSYNKTIRKNYAGIGFYYDSEQDAFIPPKPFDSWLFDNEEFIWIPPVDRPEDGSWLWDESAKQWIETTYTQEEQ